MIRVLICCFIIILIQLACFCKYISKRLKILFRVEFKPSHHVLLGHVVIHDLLRRQIGSEVTGKVRLRSIGEKCILEPEEIMLHPLFDVVRENSNI